MTLSKEQREYSELALAIALKYGVEALDKNIFYGDTLYLDSPLNKNFPLEVRAGYAYKEEIDNEPVEYADDADFLLFCEELARNHFITETENGEIAVTFYTYR